MIQVFVLTCILECRLNNKAKAFLCHKIACDWLKVVKNL